MSDVITIFILIGLAHWASHIIQCTGCLSVIGQFSIVLIEGVRKVFGWPLDLPRYFRDMSRVSLPANARVVELAQEKGESIDDFVKRATETAKVEIAKTRKDARNE